MKISKLPVLLSSTLAIVHSSKAEILENFEKVRERKGTARAFSAGRLFRISFFRVKEEAEK